MAAARHAKPGAFYDEPDNEPNFKQPFDADEEVNLRFEKADLKPIAQIAVQFMFETIVAQLPRHVTIVAIGPLTNVALLVECYPEVRPAIERVVAMGGAVGRGDVNPAAEANVSHDPHALQFDLQSRVPLVLVPLDVKQQLPFSEEARAALSAGGTRFGAFMLRLVDVQHQNVLGIHGFGWTHGSVIDSEFMHDACAVAFAIDALHATRDPRYQSFFELKPMHVLVDTACATIHFSTILHSLN